MARYDLNQLDPQSFTELCNALLLRVISERVTPGPLLGPDAGIDAYYQGPGKGDWSAWDGSWIFQYKFHNVARQGVDKCRRVVRRDVERELEKVFREYRHCANNYILITNVPYAPTPGSAARKWLNCVAAQYVDSGLQRVDLWDLDKLNGLLDIHPDLIPRRPSYDSTSFVGDYARLRDAYIDPWPIFERVNLDRFVGREWLLAAIEDFLGSHDRGYFVLEAAAGMGKTTFLAWLTREKGYIHHFSELAPGPENVGRALKNLAAQLVLTYHLNPDIPEQGLLDEAARPDFLYSLLKLAAQGRGQEDKIVVIIDSLETAGTPLGQNVLGLPQTLPEGVFVIASQRPVPVPLYVDEAATRKTVLHLAAESADNRVDVREFLDKFAKQPDVADLLRDSAYPPQRLAEILTEKCRGVWVYLHYIVSEIAQGRRQPQDLEALPGGLVQYYVRYWQHWRQQDRARWYGAYLPLLATLAAAQEPVTVDQLLRWTETNLSKPEARSLLREDWRAFINLGNSGLAESYSFYHPTLPEFFHGRMEREQLATAEKAFVDELAEATLAAHHRIADHYLQAGPLQPVPARCAPDYQYGLRHTPAHLIATGRWEDLDSRFYSRDLVEARFEAGMLDDTVADLAAASQAGQPWANMLTAFVRALGVAGSEPHEFRLSSGQRNQLRTALNYAFGPYLAWPPALREALESSRDFQALAFVAELHDMEGRYVQAAELFRRLFERTATDDPEAHARACVWLAMAYDHQGRNQEAYALLDDLASSPDAESRYGGDYWWVQYHLGISLCRLRRYDEARAILDRVLEKPDVTGLSTSALHQLGVIDFEVGDYGRAEERFKQCLERRKDERWNHRRAYEHRRLGQVYASTGRLDEAQRAFDETLEISRRCGHLRYVNETQEDIARFLIAAHLGRERPESIRLDDLTGRFHVDPSFVPLAFHALADEMGVSYLETLDPDSATSTGRAVRWDIAHSQGWWHASVSVLVVDEHGHLALQERGERDSRGRWDVSVAGHVDVGEDDVTAAARETREEIGLVVAPDRLVRFGVPYAFRKRGGPSVGQDGHEPNGTYVYRTDKVSCERASVFILGISTGEKRQVAASGSEGALSVRWEDPTVATQEAEAEPVRFASAFKQLFGHEETRAALLQAIESELYHDKG